MDVSRKRTGSHDGTGFGDRYIAGEERWAVLEGLRMRYLALDSRVSSPVKPPVIFVHGLLGYSFSWRHNLEVFAADRKVFAVDLPGIGFSDRVPRGSADLSFEANARRLLAFVRELGLGKVDVVASSHGGAIAMAMAYLDSPSKVPVLRRLVLVSPANPHSRSGRKRLKLFNTPLGEWILRLTSGASGAVNTWALGRMYSDRKKLTDETRSGYRAALRMPGSIDYALEIVRGWKKDMEILEARLQTPIEIPTLLLWGEDDRAVPVASAGRLQTSFADSQLQVLKNVGHLPYEEAPDEFNAIVREFLDSGSTGHGG